MYAQTDPIGALEQLYALTGCEHALLASGKVAIDTARVYQDGHTEKVLGGILQRNPELREKVEIHTKVSIASAPYCLI